MARHNRKNSRGEQIYRSAKNTAKTRLLRESLFSLLGNDRTISFFYRQENELDDGGHPVLRWMMDNIFIRTDPAGNIKTDKEKSTEKIDGAVATIKGLDRAIRCGNVNSESVYDNRGILFI